MSTDFRGTGQSCVVPVFVVVFLAMANLPLKDRGLMKKKKEAEQRKKARKEGKIIINQIRLNKKEKELKENNRN